MSEIAWLFYHLWLKPHTMTISKSDLNEFEEIKETRKGMKLVKFPFEIPETLIYKSGKVQDWYFKSKEDVVLKKNKSTIKPDYILEKFNKDIKKLKCPVVATAYNSCEEETVTGASKLSLTTHHIRSSALRSLIKFEDKSFFTVFQKFVPPKEDRNCLIKCVWTPTLMSIYKRTNPNYLIHKKKEYNYRFSRKEEDLVPTSTEEDAKNIGFYGKIITYEGPQDMSYEEQVFSTKVMKEVTQAIDAIVEHLSQQEITLLSANFFFKYSRNDKIYLCFATNINVNPENYQEVAMDREVTLKIPEKEDLFNDPESQNRTSSVPRPIGPKDVRIRPTSSKPEQAYRSLVSQNRLKYFCPLCEQKISLDDGYEYTMKTIIDLINFYQDNFDSEDTKLSDRLECLILPMKIKTIKISKSRRSEARQQLKTIPLPIRALYPGMSYQTYKQKMKDPLFLYDSVKLCEKCYNFIRNLQEIKDEYDQYVHKENFNHDLKIMESIYEEKSLIHNLSPEKSAMKAFEGLNEQGMMTSKKSNGSNDLYSKEEAKDSPLKDEIAKLRSRSEAQNLLRPDQETSDLENIDIGQPKIFNFYSIKGKIDSDSKHHHVEIDTSCPKASSQASMKKEPERSQALFLQHDEKVSQKPSGQTSIFSAANEIKSSDLQKKILSDYCKSDLMPNISQKFQSENLKAEHNPKADLLKNAFLGLQQYAKETEDEPKPKGEGQRNGEFQKNLSRRKVQKEQSIKPRESKLTNFYQNRPYKPALAAHKKTKKKAPKSTLRPKIPRPEYPRFQGEMSRETYNKLMLLADHIERNNFTQDGELPENLHEIQHIPGQNHSIDPDDLYPEEANSEKPHMVPKRLKIQQSRRKRPRPSSCKRYGSAVQKIKNHAFMISNNSSNRFQRMSQCKEGQEESSINQSSHTAPQMIGLTMNSTNPSRIRRKTKDSFSTINRGNVTEYQPGRKPKRKPTSRERELEIIKRKYAAYRSNISNLHDQRPIIPAKSKTKKKKSQSMRRKRAPKQKSQHLGFPDWNQIPPEFRAELEALADKIRYTQMAENQPQNLLHNPMNEGSLEIQDIDYTTNQISRPEMFDLNSPQDMAEKAKGENLDLDMLNNPAPIDISIEKDEVGIRQDWW
ncbi:unnamed protein product [Moneuplotes crassus]|uniref:Uncharacterized protein n=1 Tax=Euplotes crassus TaxID=5936 RepID=A0AAD1XE79_EUPCR|nr:unnamed protein product [Moneuplotes crassus]